MPVSVPLRMVVWGWGLLLLLAPQVAAQQPAARQPAAGRPAATANVRSAGAPNWFPLPPEYENHLNQILAYWENSTSRIQRYRCGFKRWEYEMVRQVDAQGKVSFTSVVTSYSEGAIKYAAPDKGLFRVDSIKHRAAPQQPGGQPQWVEQQGGPKEHWVCDGKSIFQFDYLNKQLIERPLPPEMQGKQIAEGPLPFLFGAKADKIKARFWIRVLPPLAEGEYRLEALPKTRDDAQNFRALHVMISQEPFLPKAMVLFHRNNAKTTYVFEKRETNWNVTLNMLNLFHREFYEPAPPDRSWKKVVEPLQQPAAADNLLNATRPIPGRRQ